MTASATVARNAKALKVLLLPLAVTLCACAARPVALPPPYQQAWISFFVAHAEGDGSNMEQGIAAELRNRGFEATGASFEQMPADTDVLVIYSDSWWANILAQGEILRLEARDARTGYTIASAEQRWASHVFDAPSTLIADAVAQLFGPSLTEAR